MFTGKPFSDGVIDSKLPAPAVDILKPLMLVIDDSDDMRSVMKFEFKDAYRVIEAPNGVIGYTMAVTQLPDVIVSDVSMPVIDGITLCKQLKENELTNHIPVLLITVEDAEEFVLAGLKNGADDYITKPFRISILKAKVNSLLESRQLLLKHYNHLAPLETKVSAVQSSNETFIQKVNTIIEAHLSIPIFEAADFALEIGMSRAQLYRKIKSITGYSVKEYIRITRLKKAAGMLINSMMNISEVAYEAGFSSVPYFSSSFKKYFKVTPREFITNSKLS